MAEYIERNKVLEKATSTGLCDAQGNMYGAGDVVLADDIKAIPAADVARVRHGRWEFDSRSAEWGYPYLCTQCGKAHNNEEPYCPNCGAKMDMK